MPVPDAIMAMTVSSFERKEGVKQASTPAKRAETTSSDNPGAGRAGRAAGSLDNEALCPPVGPAWCGPERGNLTRARRESGARRGDAAPRRRARLPCGSDGPRQLLEPVAASPPQRRLDASLFLA